MVGWLTTDTWLTAEGDDTRSPSFAGAPPAAAAPAPGADGCETRASSPGIDGRDARGSEVGSPGSAPAAETSPPGSESAPMSG